MSIKRLSIYTFVLTFCLIVFEGYMTSTQGGTLIAYTHRGIGVVLGIFTVTLFVKIRRTKVSLVVRKAAHWMMALYIVQMLLNAVVVWFQVPTAVLTVQIATSLIFLACVILIWRRENENKEGRINRLSLTDEQQTSISTHTKISLGLLFLIVIVGATASSNLGQEWIQTAHRVLGFVFAIYIVTLTFRSYVKKWDPQLQHRFTLAAIIVLVQMTIGFLTIVTSIDMFLVVLHVVIGTLLFTVIAEARIFMTMAMGRVKLRVLSNKQVPPKRTFGESYRKGKKAERAISGKK